MNYTQYTEEDFVKDPYFRKWILNRDHSAQHFWDQWILEHPEKKNTIENATNLLLLIHAENNEGLSEREAESLWQNILQEREKISNAPSEYKTSSQITAGRFIRWAATFIGIAGTTYAVHHFNFGTEKSLPNLNGPQITLQLEDGRVQVLDESAYEVITNGEGEKVVEQEKNTLVYSSKKTEDQKPPVYNELRVPYGKKFGVVLSDGSHVFLNSGTKLRYPVVFPKNGGRDVFLDGEAYFKVASDTSRPFTVITDKMNTRVYGTEFNVSSYVNDHDPATVLVEGSVGVYKTQDSIDTQAVKIVPGQRALFSNGNITLDQVNVGKHIAWTKGKLYFIDDRFDEIIKELERHFNITIDNQIHQLNQKRFTGTFTKESLHQILKVFQEHTPFEYRTLGSTITIIEKP